MATTSTSSPGRWAVGSTYTKFLTCLGASSPILLSPLLFHGTKGSRSGFCISTVSILLLTETLPAPIVSLLPLFLYNDLGFAEDAGQPMSSLSSCMAHQEREYQRRRLLPSSQSRSGLPSTSGAITFSEMADTDSPTPIVSPAALSEPRAQAAPVVPLRRLGMGGKEERGVTAAQRNITERGLSLQDTNDATRPILPAISKAPTSAVSRVLSTPLPSSASFHDNPPGKSQPASGPLIASERSDQGASTSSAQPLRCPNLKSSLESEPLSDEQGLLRSRPRPHRPSLAMGGGHKIGAKKTRKRTSIMEGGKIVLPGASSPPPKTIVSQSDDLSSFLYGTRRPGREYVGVKYQKQQTIHRHLAVTTVLTCALSSALSLSRNHANIYFVEYFRDRFNVEVTSHLVWTSLLLPMQCVALMVAWLHVRIFILREYDLELTENTQANVHLFLQKKRQNLGSIGRSECIPVLLFCAWTLVHSVTDRDLALRPTPDEMHPLAVLCLVIAYSLPFTKWLHGVFIDFDGIVRRLPWGAIITIAGSDAIMFIIKMSGFSQWLSAQLQRYAPNQLAMQCALAICSSLLTELVSNSSAVSILLPVAVDIAVTTPCNPLYFAIPVTVAASTSLVLPTSSINIAVLTNLTDTGPVQMLLLGLVVKFVALVMILLTVNLNTDFHRLPQWIFTERKNQTITTMTTMFF